MVLVLLGKPPFRATSTLTKRFKVDDFIVIYRFQHLYVYKIERFFAENLLGPLTCDRLIRPTTRYHGYPPDNQRHAEARIIHGHNPASLETGQRSIHADMAPHIHMCLPLPSHVTFIRTSLSSTSFRRLAETRCTTHLITCVHLTPFLLLFTCVYTSLPHRHGRMWNARPLGLTGNRPQRQRTSRLTTRYALVPNPLSLLCLAQPQIP